MKKLFTLIAAALFAVSASAKEAIDVSSLYSEGTTINFDAAWQWKGITMSTGSLVEDNDAKTADDTGVTYYNASAFDYIVVKYSASTADVNLIAQYNCKGTIGKYGAEYNQGQITIEKSATGGIIGLALDATYKKTINAIALQTGNATGTLTIEEIYFATTAEWEAVKPAPPTTKEIDFTSFSGYVAADKNFVFEAGKAGWYSKWIGTLDPDYFKYLVVEVASSTGDVQLVIQGTKSEGATPAENLMITKTESAKTFYADIEGWSNISQFAFQNFNFSDPENEDWDAKQASAMETTMVITAMYLSKDKPAVDEGGEETAAGDTWNFETAISAADKASLEATGSTWKAPVTTYKKDADGNTTTEISYVRYELNTELAAKVSNDFGEFVTLKGNDGTELECTKGLKFARYNNALKAGNIRIDAYSRLGLNGGGLAVSIPGLKKDDVIKIKFASAGDEARGFDLTNAKTNDADAKTQILSGKDKAAVEFELKVVADGEVILKSTNGVYIYAIAVNAALPTGIQETVAPVKVIENNVIYNLAGQRVNESYKGIVIKNGKKFIQK